MVSKSGLGEAAGGAHGLVRSDCDSRSVCVNESKFVIIGGGMVVMNRPDKERDIAPKWIESRQVASAERLADVSHSVLEASEISS